MFVLFRNCPPCGSEQTKSVERQEAGGGGVGVGRQLSVGEILLTLDKEKTSVCLQKMLPSH